MEHKPGAPRRPKGCGRFLHYAEKVLTRMAALYGIFSGEPKRYYMWMNPDEPGENKEKRRDKK